MSINSDALALVAKVNKTVGAGAMTTGSEMVIARRYPTGSVGLDVILGGGWAGNQWSEVIGKESNGKTAIVLKTVAANQKADPEFTTLWVAAEHYDLDQAIALGVDNDRVIVMPTQDMELAYETMLQFAESQTVDLIVLDSYPALIPGEEAEKTMEDVVVALGARLTGKFFRKAGSATRRSLAGEDRPIFGLIINQYRDQIGGFSPHGPAQTTPGGKAKNYFFYTRVEVRRDDFIDEARPGQGKSRVGQTIKIRTIKNKAAPPQQVCTIDFYFRDAPFLGFNRGDYDTTKEILTYGIFYKIIDRRGAYYFIGEKRWGPGKDTLLDELRDNVELLAELHAKILETSAKPDREIYGDSK